MPFFVNKKRFLISTLFLIELLFVSTAVAGQNQGEISTNLMGMTGLNSIPNARMNEKGTIRLGAGTTDPYLHSFIGFQLADPLYINLRQTAEISSLNDSAKRLYPALDFKLRLVQESQNRPEISIGANAAFGHKRTASEYIAVSKRFGNLDLTAGTAWGRMAGKGHIKNPMRAISSHFDKNRNPNNENANNAHHWFTGEEIAFFGGVEYFTPLKGLSLKADYDPTNYQIETTTNSGFNKPQPWSLGLNYKPWKQTDLTIGILGGEKIMARLSLQDNIQKWPGKLSRKTETPELIFPREIFDNDENTIKTRLDLSSHQSIGQQIGHFARQQANQLPNNKERLEISLFHKNIKGPKLTLIRQDLEKAILHNHGSAEEIWRDAILQKNKNSSLSFREYLKNKDYRKTSTRFILDNKFSLSEKDSTALYRSSLIIENEKKLPFGFMLGFEPKINLADNIEQIRATRTQRANPTRSDEDDFAATRLSINRLYASWLKSITQNTHVQFSAGFLEEMFGGFGGEILYRPFGKTYAIGAEAWHVQKRLPSDNADLSFQDNENFTGHLNLFYELPNKNTTFYGKIGQYLDNDFGATFGIQNQFQNGTKLEGFLTATNEKDIDSFNGTSQLYGGIKFTLPIGNIPYTPSGSEIRIKTAPFSRDKGQILNAPNKLYDVTEPTSYRRLSQSWSDLLH